MRHAATWVWLRRQEIAIDAVVLEPLHFVLELSVPVG